MTQQTNKLIIGVNFRQTPAVENPTINWTKNHGKFIHEFTYKQSKKEILQNVNSSLKALQANLQDTVELAKKAMSSLNQDIENETERAGAEEKRLQGEINDLTKSLNSLSENLQKFETKEGQDVEKLNQSLQKVSENLTTLSNTVGTISSNYDSLNTRVSTLESTVQNLQKTPTIN